MLTVVFTTQAQQCEAVGCHPGDRDAQGAGEAGIDPGDREGIVDPRAVHGTARAAWCVNTQPHSHNNALSLVLKERT